MTGARTDALCVIAQARAEDHRRKKVNDWDRAWAQELLNRLRRRGLAVVQVSGLDAVGPGGPAVQAPTRLHAVSCESRRRRWPE